MKPHPEMIEGPEALKRFEETMATMFSAKKSTLPPSPFGKSGKKRKKPEAQKG